ncbi:MAG: hypothetical protein ACK5SX_08225 [Sandaracinobacter sp.]
MTAAKPETDDGAPYRLVWELIWNKIQPAEGDPESIAITLDVPVMLAKALSVYAAVEDRMLEETAIEGLVWFTGLNRFFLRSGSGEQEQSKPHRD